MAAHLEFIESSAFTRGLPPEGIDILLNCAISAKLADLANVRLIKCLIPATFVPESAVVSAVSLFSTDKSSKNMQVLFIRWLIAVFDLIDSKEHLHCLYGLLFFFLQEEKLCPYICHLLYLLTRRENVKPFRVRRLLDLQSKMGAQPHLQALLSLYKVFCPELVSLSLSSKLKTFFKNSDVTWKSAISTVQSRNRRRNLVHQPLIISERQPKSKKRKWNSNMQQPICSSTSDNKSKLPDFIHQSTVYPVEKLQTLPQLLENIHHLEFPSQMGSVLKSPLLLHYLNCIKDDHVLFRLHFWVAHVLQEEFPWCRKGDDDPQELEFTEFLNTVCNAQQFLQEGFSNIEDFACWKLLRWDGICCRTQIFTLLSWIPCSTFSEMKSLFCEPLMQLFFTSSVYFKCSVIESLKNLLNNWLLQHSVQEEMNIVLMSQMNTSQSGSFDAVAELIEFVGRISTIALCIENYNSLLLYFILSFYESVCNMFVKHDFPLVIMPPAGVFYPALLSMESVSVNQLCYIMHRYRINLIAAKTSDTHGKFKINRKTVEQFNRYLVAMVGYLWTANGFSADSNPQGILIDQEILEQTGVLDYKNSFTLVRHPAFMGYAIKFLQRRWPQNETINLSLIKGKKRDWYVEFLYSQELNGLKLFIEASINRSNRF
ncbi:centromere protein I [Latimeria chalumnae]